MRYHLSNRQIKDLRSGAIIRIALPLPHNYDSDLRQFVSRRLALDTDVEIKSIERCNLPINPLSHAAGMNSVLGEILHGQAELDDDNALVLSVDCVIVDLRNVTASLYGATYPTRWPAKVTLPDGRTLPATSP